jgi:hypothetical protein
VPDIHPALRADVDREMAEAVDGLLCKAAEYDGLDLVEANVEMTNDIFAAMPPPMLAAAAAMLALRLHRTPGGGRG